MAGFELEIVLFCMSLGGVGLLVVFMLRQ